jgi:uncharacterized protein YxjI
MAIQVKCSNEACGKVLRVRDQLAGKIVKCPGCQRPVQIPKSKTSTAVSEEEVMETVRVPRRGAAPSGLEANPGESDEGAGATARLPPRPAARPPAKAPAKPETQAPAKPPAKPVTQAPAKAAAPAESEADEQAPAGSVWQESELLRRKRFMIKQPLFSLWGYKTNLVDPDDTNQQIGIAAERFSWAFAALKTIGPVRSWLPTLVEVRESRDGPILFTVRKVGNPFSFWKTLQIYDDQNELLGSFKTKLFSILGGFHIYDADGEEVAEVKGKLGMKTPPVLQFVSKDGRELGKVVSQVHDSVAKGKKSLVVMGTPGIIAEVSDEMNDQPRVKVLVLATALSVDLTGSGKQLVGGR